jgi:hypothetical protein
MEGITYLDDRRAKQGDFDSSEEEEIKEQEKSYFTLQFDTQKALDYLSADSELPIVICGLGNPQALLRILFDTELEEISSISTVEKSN